MMPVDLDTRRRARDVAEALAGGADRRLAEALAGEPLRRRTAAVLGGLGFEAEADKVAGWLVAYRQLRGGLDAEAVALAFESAGVDVGARLEAVTAGLLGSVALY